MAVSTFFGLQTSLRGLLAHQRSLDVTGHNVSNASTVGYSRQEAVLEATLPMHIAAGARPDGSGAQLGAGVEVSEYRRVRDIFLDVQYRAQASVLGDSEARARSLEGVDLAMAEPGDNGIAAQLAKLWSSWNAVANDSSSLPAKQALVEQSKTVASAFAEFDGQLKAIAAQAQTEYDSLVAYNPALGIYGEIGAIATELAQVGGAIRNAFEARQTPNDLLDHRDALLDRLAKYGTVSTVDHGDGGMRVLFGNMGTPLVDDHRVDNPATPGDDRVVFVAADLIAPGGKLGALQDLANPVDGMIKQYRDDLAAIVSSLAGAINGKHLQGPSATPFFAYDAAQGASGLTVVRTPADVEPGRSAADGSNDLALEIAALRAGAVDQAYGALVARVGAEVRQNQRTQANAEVLAGAVEDRRQSASGVSLDEEMTNLIRFQRGYQASARTMSTLDEMLDVLINRTGRVGL